MLFKVKNPVVKAIQFKKEMATKHYCNYLATDKSDIRLISMGLDDCCNQCKVHLFGKEENEECEYIRYEVTIGNRKLRGLRDGCWIVDINGNDSSTIISNDEFKKRFEPLEDMP